MARQKGSANFAGTLEVLAGGPLDARSQVPTKADLTTASNFPYPYVGMQVYVISEGKRYTLKVADVTVLANWEEEGSGGSSGGHTIEDNDGTALTQRDTLQFGGDLEVSDDSQNEKTVVTPHELTVAELAEIVSPLPGAPVDLPVLFDESGAEYQVGWYKFSNGTKKPIYTKHISGSTSLTYLAIAENVNNWNIDDVVNIIGIIKGNEGTYVTGPDYYSSTNFVRFHYETTNGGKIYLHTGSEHPSKPLNYKITLQYTKTNDTPS